MIGLVHIGGVGERCVPDIANHDDSKMKGDRSMLKWHSIYIKQLTGATVPVGSGKKKKPAKYIIITAIVVVVVFLFCFVFFVVFFFVKYGCYLLSMVD